MNFDYQSIIQWAEKVFSNQQLSNDEMIHHMRELLNNDLEISKSPAFYYEVAKVNSVAAFILFQMQQQHKLSRFFNLEDTHISPTRMFPMLDSKKNIVVLNNGAGFKFNSGTLRLIEKPLAFRSLNWHEVNLPAKGDFVYKHEDLELFLSDDILLIAAIIAGAKNKSYQISSEYAARRIQGGRIIKEWSSVQVILSDLYLSVKNDQALMNKLDVASAFLILRDADNFVSKNMQVLGGAGYTEDYVVERLYRECIFLKNWPKPFKSELIKHFQNVVMSL